MRRPAEVRRIAVIGTAFALGLVTLAARGGDSGGAPQERSMLAIPASSEFPCPPDGRVIPAGGALQPVIDAAFPGEVLCLSPGRYEGPVEIRGPLVLSGPVSAVIHSDGSGTTLRAVADHVVLRGFSVQGSGRRYDKMDGAVYLSGRGIEARGLTVREALFGIVVERSDSVTIADNHVFGLAELPVGIRGDGIRLWEVRTSAVVHNRLEDSRDILVWYSPGNRIVGNTVLRSRYATHFMYSDDCVVADAEYHENIVGVFVMYSRGITLRGNTISENAVGDGMGLGVKESGNLRVEDNRFIHDNSCLYLDTSPFREGDTVLVRGNEFTRCNAAVTFHSSEQHNTFSNNTFRDNQTQVAVEGRGTAQDVSWKRNYFDDYQGYDMDGDGTGDVPYELRSLSERLVSNHPKLAFFRGTIALDLLDLAARVFPLLQPETLLVDPQPRMSPSGTA